MTPQQIILAAEVTTEANDVQQLKPMLDLAQAVVEMVMGEDAVLGAAAADAGYWSEDNAASQIVECELFIATRQDRQQRAELRDAPAPRGRMPKGLSARERMQRKLRTKRGRAIYRQRGASVEPVFGQMKERQDAGRFSMRGLSPAAASGTCRPPPTTCASYTGSLSVAPDQPQRGTPTATGPSSKPPEARQGRLLTILNRFKRRRPAIQQQAP